MSWIQSYCGDKGSCHAVVSQVVSRRLLRPRLTHVTVVLLCAQVVGTGRGRLLKRRGTLLR